MREYNIIYSDILMVHIHVTLTVEKILSLVCKLQNGSYKMVVIKW